MKRFALLGLVLGVSVCAVGGMYLEAMVPLEGLRPGESLEIKVIGEVLNTPVSGFLAVFGPGWIDGGRIVYPGGGEYHDEDVHILVVDPTMPDDSSWWMLGSFLPVPPVPYSGVLIDQIQFTCGGPGMVTVVLWDESGDVLDRVQIPQTPEPCTVGLLGLGAVIGLRRRGTN